MTDFRPFSTPSPLLVFPAATSKLNCTPTRKPPIPIEWDFPILLDPYPPRLLWTKIDTTLQRHRRLQIYPQNPSPPTATRSLYSSSSSSSSSSSYVSSMISTQSSGGRPSLHPQDDTISFHLYHARFAKKKSRLRGLVARMKRAAERPFRLMES